jgi:Tol biopolymer transport system component
MCFSIGPSADAPTVRTTRTSRVPALNAMRATLTTAAACALLLTAGCGDAATPPPSAVGTHVGTSAASSSRASEHQRAQVAAVEQLGRRGSRLVLTDVTTGRRRVLARSAVWRGDVGLAAPVFSPDGRRIAVALSTQDQDYVRHTRLLVVATDGHRPARAVPRLRLLDVDDPRPAWTPDGRALAVPAGGDDTELVDVATGARRPLLAHGGYDLAFAPDGRTYTFDGPGGVWLGDTASGATRRIVAGARGARFSPDGRRIAFLSTRDRNGSVEVHEAPPATAAELYVAGADGSHARRLTTTRAEEAGPLRWTLDGRDIVFARFADGRLTTRALTVATRCERALDLAGAGLADADLRLPQRWGTSSSSTSSRGTSPHSCSSR